MKKTSILIIFVIIASTLFTFAACTDIYETCIGTYEGVYISSNESTNTISDYEYFTIELKSERNFTIKYKRIMYPYTACETTSKFEINGEKLIETVGLIVFYMDVHSEPIITEADGSLTNEYKFKDDVITLEIQDSGVTIIVIFENKLHGKNRKGLSVF